MHAHVRRAHTYLSLTASENIVPTTSDVEKYQNAIFYGVVKLKSKVFLRQEYQNLRNAIFNSETEISSLRRAT